MKEFISNRENLNKVEFWAATTIFVFAVFFLISNAINVQPMADAPGKAKVPLNYYFVSNLVRYSILYLAFLLLSFRIVPKLIRGEDQLTQIVLLILAFIITGFVFGLLPTMVREQFTGIPFTDTANTIAFQRSFLYAAWLAMIFGFYSVIKYAGISLLLRAGKIHEKYPFIRPEALAAFVIWMVVLLMLVAGRADSDLIALWCVVVPAAIFFYCYSFYRLIPKALEKKKPFLFYAGRTFLIMVLTFFFIFLFSLLLTEDEDDSAMVSFFNLVVQLFVTAPLSWVLFKQHLKGNEEVYILKKELGQSNANFDFLRSQINPHFLFNALNTIYGTAIQEKAERTSEAIEKLGDMMRFMLQENMQEKISLSREVDYLDNYISFQKLRTESNAMVRIQSAIAHDGETVQIAPMLLIPFVENAFKHGISQKEASDIKITLELKDHTLYFDVANSKHLKQENDPEKNRSGIGLKNVRERLELLYPRRHELVIRETAKDFFVHLTLDLSPRRK